MLVLSFDSQYNSQGGCGGARNSYVFAVHQSAVHIPFVLFLDLLSFVSLSNLLCSLEEVKLKPSSLLIKSPVSPWTKYCFLSNFLS